MNYPSVKRDRFLRALRRIGVEVEEARGGGSGNKLRFLGRQTFFHCHPSKELGPNIWLKTVKDLGIDPEVIMKEM